MRESFADSPLPESVDGIVAFPHGEGCGQAMGADTEQLQRTLEGVLDHPNVSAALILGLGCEVNQIDHYLGRNRRGYDAGDLARIDVAGLGRDARDSRGGAETDFRIYRSRGSRKANPGAPPASWPLD